MNNNLKKHMPCGLCGNPNNGVFCTLEDPAKEILNKEKAVQIFKKNDLIFQEGSPAGMIYCIHVGRIKLYKSDTNGNQQVIRILGPGDIVGFRPLLANENYAATAQAIDETTMCAIPKKTLLQMLGISKELTFELFCKLSIELRVSEEQLISLLHYSVKQRLAILLLKLMDNDHVSSQSNRTPVTPLKRFEMAQIIGTTPETLSRTLKILAEEKAVDFTRKAIHIIDINILNKIARNSQR